MIGIETNDLADLGLEATQGGTELGRGTVVIGAMVSNNFYNPRQRPGEEPPPPPDLYGQQIQLVISKWDEQGGDPQESQRARDRCFEGNAR